jgi:hypothetical protein
MDHDSAVLVSYRLDMYIGKNILTRRRKMDDE